VDLLAKKAIKETDYSTEVRYGKYEELRYKLYWNDILVEEAPRKFMKGFSYLTHKSNWLSQKHNILLATNLTNVDID